MNSPAFAPVQDLADALWLPGNLEKPWGRGSQANYAASVIPRGFAAYARVFHPPYCVPDQREATWEEAAKYYNRQYHPQIQWHALTKFSASTGEPRFVEPDKGHLPENQAEALIHILRRFTDTPDICRFAVWDGWGLLVREQWPQAASLHLPGRTYILLGGPIEAVGQSVSAKFQQSASLWWPRDKSWCVATEIDMMWTYVGGSEACIKAILEDTRLEALPATLDDRADAYGDLVNT